MANPQEREVAPQDLALAAMAQKQMGAAPPPPGGPAPGGPAPASAPAAAPQEQDTAQDKASTAGAPETEADKQDLPPMVYKIKMGDEERELTPEQISGTFERYGKMNEMQEYMRPVLQLAAGAIKANPGLTPEKFATSLLEMANTHNKEMGGEDQKPNEQVATKTEDATDISEKLKQWEEQNGASLPPGYTDMLQANQGVQGQMQQMMQMMQQVLGRSSGILDGAKSATEQAANTQVNNAKTRIANNLAAVQQKLGLPDEAEQDFMMFSAERGFTAEDFLNPALLMRVATDFKNSMESGEVDRLREIAQRRQAFTGTIDSQPQGQGLGAPADLDQNLERMIDKRLG